MIAGIEMMSCPNLSVPAEVMQHIVNVESGKNPYAIGVVGGQLVRQPQNMGEAVSTAQMLESKGYNYSLGISQVNRNNLGKYGLDSYDKAFSVCSNLEAGSRILAECYNSSGGDWGKAFSCYYSGNFVTGYRTGYVQKVFDSINRTAMSASNPVKAAPIQLVGDAPVNPRVTPLPTVAENSNPQVPVYANSAAYRVAIRSSLIDTALNSLVSPAVAAAAEIDPASAQAPVSTQAQAQPQPAAKNSLQKMMQQVQQANYGDAPVQAPVMATTPGSMQQMMQQVQQANYGNAQTQAQAPTGTPAGSMQQMMQQVQQANYGNAQVQAQAPTGAPTGSMQQMMQQVQQANYGPAQTQDPNVQAAMAPQAATMATAPAASSNDIFEPQVRGPNDPIQSAPQAVGQQAVAAPQVTGQPNAPAAPATDPSVVRQGNSDDAFVF